MRGESALPEAFFPTSETTGKVEEKLSGTFNLKNGKDMHCAGGIGDRAGGIDLESRQEIQLTTTIKFPGAFAGPFSFKTVSTIAKLVAESHRGDPRSLRLFDKPECPLCLSRSLTGTWQWQLEDRHGRGRARDDLRIR